MARTYREIAMEEMLRTVEETMSSVIEWRGDLPASAALKHFFLGITLIELWHRFWASALSDNLNLCCTGREHNTAGCRTCGAADTQDASALKGPH
jgi:hypothetical protein